MVELGVIINKEHVMKLSQVFQSMAMVFAISGLAIAAPSTWDIDAYHSTIGFKVKHMMVSNVNGNFGKFTGTIEADETDVTKSKVNVSIDISSVNTGIAKRDEHLRSPDFFDAVKFPSMTFVSKSVKVIGKDKLQVTGDLTMHGVTKSVVLDVDGPTQAVKDPTGNVKRGVVATTKINRKDFGLSYNAVLEAGGVMIGEEVAITLELELIKK